MKVKFDLTIQATIHSEGSWDKACTLTQVMQQAKDAALSYSVLLQRGATAPVTVPATITLTNLQIDPSQ